MRKRVAVVCLFLLPVLINAQELFPHNEPASNSPKGALGVKISNEFYEEITVLRSMQNCKFMWAFTPQFMITPGITFSNHHGKKLPDSFIANDGTIGTHTHGIKKGVQYPYSFENAAINLKYRFFNNDKEHYHFRMATYIDLATGNRPHDEAEPGLMGDNSGVGAGLIATLLKQKFAVSLNSGLIIPGDYTQNSSQKITIRYGNAYYCNLSTGYLLLPFEYKSYKQTNLNLYLEFSGKKYDAPAISLNGEHILIADAPGLEKGSYIEVHPSVQLIIQSQTRLDFGASFPLINRSYVRYYPLLYFGIQRYFFFKKSK